MVMTTCEAFESNGKFDIARANDVLYLEVGELCVEAKLLNNASIFS